MLRYIKLICLLLLSLVLFACSANEEGASNTSGSADSDKPAEPSSDIGEDIRIAIPAAPPNLDSHTSTSQNIADVGRHIFENLVTVDSDFNVQPMLAESWEQSEDGKTITFNLRKGVLFHNGKELKSEDVIASLERWIRLSTLGKADFEGATLEEIDEYTFVIQLPAPVSTALSSLAYGGGNYASIMPKEVVENAPDEGVEEYIGTGPFQFEEWRQDQYIYLTKFDDYQALDSPKDGLAGKKEALVEGLYFMIVTDASTRIAGIQTAEYDVIQDVPLDTVEQINNNAEIETFIDPYGELNIFLNKSNGFFTEVKAREALLKGIDKVSILQAAFTDEAYYILDHSLMMNFQSALWSSDEGKEQYFMDSNPEEAEALLKEAGYDGEEIRMITSKEKAYLYNSSVVLKQQLDQMGLNTNLEVYDWPTYLQKRSDPDAFDLLIGASTPKLDPTSMYFLKDDFVGWTKSEELDEIVKEFKSAPSIDEAKPIYNDLQKWFYEYIPVVKIGDFTMVNAATKNISGYDYLDGPMFWNVTNSK